MTHDFDFWMNASGIGGVLLYLLSYWLLMRGMAQRTNLLNRFMRLAGLTLILIPLFLRWYLHGSLLLLIGASIACVSGFFLLLQHRDKA